MTFWDHVQVFWHRFASYIVVGIIGAVFVLIGLGMYKQSIEQNKITDNCTPTTLYVIGDKGHVNRIYDCGYRDW